MTEPVIVGGRYILEDQLGEGGFGEVYRVRHAELGKRFALKIISPYFATDTDARNRFTEEAKMASEITHANIVAVVDYGEDEKLGAYMVMELIDGQPLWPLEEMLSVRRVCDVLSQVADALDCIHKHGIIHGDIKADNILVVEEAPLSAGGRRRQTVRLVDFGLARRRDGAAGEVAGSPHYMAPERSTGGAASASTDIYALGVLGYLLFTNTLPFEGKLVDIVIAHLHATPEPMSKRRGEELDPAIEGLIMRALAKTPAERHASAGAFRYELNTVMDMLDMGQRRRGSGPIKTQIAAAPSVAQLFHQSKLPQAVVSIGGAIVMANPRFAKLIGLGGQSVAGMAVDQTALADIVPRLMHTIREAYTEATANLVRATVKNATGNPSVELTIVCAPMLQERVHIVIHVEDLKKNR